MFVEIDDIALHMNWIGKTQWYLNLMDGEYYSDEELSQIRETNENWSDVFIRIPRVDETYIKEKFVDSLYNAALQKKLRKILKEQHYHGAFFSLLHKYDSDHDLESDLRQFAWKLLEDMAIDWCNENNVKYTFKNNIACPPER